MRVRLNLPSDREGNAFLFDQSPMITSPDHQHDELELNFLERGVCVYWIGGAIFKLPPGTMLWLFPRQPHKLLQVSSGHAIWVAYWRTSMVKRLSKGSNRGWLRQLCPEVPYLRQLNPRAALRLRHYFTSLASLHQDVDRYNAFLGYLLTEATSFWESGRDITPLQTLHPAVVRAMAILDDEDLSLPDLAKRAGLSYSRLAHIFQEQTRMSLGRFREIQRIHRFSRLFRGNLLEASMEAGFGSYAQFYRAFHRYTGITPRAWKARLTAIR